MSRINKNMPDTLYMLEPQKPIIMAPAFPLTASGAVRLEREEPLPTSQRAEENELDRYIRARRASQMSLSSGVIDVRS